jgi:hypothetical protein
MAIAGFLLFLAVVCGALAVVSAVMITAELDRRGMKTPFPFIGPMIFRNLTRYRLITLEESGRTGPLFYAYVIPINLAMVLALLAWITHR